MKPLSTLVPRSDAARTGTATYDEILSAIQNAQTISRLKEIDGLIVDVFMADEINDTQVALLRKVITVREDTIAQLATI